MIKRNIGRVVYEPDREHNTVVGHSAVRIARGPAAKLIKDANKTSASRPTRKTAHQLPNFDGIGKTALHQQTVAPNRLFLLTTFLYKGSTVIALNFS